MAYLKPPWFTRTIFNKIAMAAGVGGSETLTVTKRVSRQPREVPVPQRAPVIAAYRPLAGKVVEGYWRQLPDDADYPLFALIPGG